MNGVVTNKLGRSLEGNHTALSKREGLTQIDGKFMQLKWKTSWSHDQSAGKTLLGRENNTCHRPSSQCTNIGTHMQNFELIHKFPSLVGTRSVSYFPCKVWIPRLWDVNMAFVHHILLGCTFCCTSWIITASYGFVIGISHVLGLLGSSYMLFVHSILGNQTSWLSKSPRNELMTIPPNIHLLTMAHMNVYWSSHPYP